MNLISIKESASVIKQQIYMIYFLLVAVVYKGICMVRRSK